jgi:hypothetical protein
MAKVNTTPSNQRLVVGVDKRTKQGGKAKTSSMSKNEKRSYKRYRGQGK